MPATFGIGTILALDQYGKFIAISPPSFDIVAAHAVSITATDTQGWIRPYNQNVADCVQLEIPIESGWGAIVERFNWGETSRPDKVFYEIWVDPGQLAPYTIEEFFHCCGVVTSANIDNRSTHPSSGIKLTFRIWNRTASPGLVPEDVHVELAGWMYKFKLEFLDKLIRMGYEGRQNALDEINSHLGAIRELLAPEVGIAPSPPVAARLR